MPAKSPESFDIAKIVAKDNFEGQFHLVVQPFALYEKRKAVISTPLKITGLELVLQS